MKRLMKYYAVTAGGLVVIIGGIFMLTDPERLPAAAYIIFFTLLYGLCVAVLSILGFAAKHMQLIPWRLRRIQKMAALVAVLPVFLLLLQSVGLLTLRDVLLAAGITILLYLYFNRMAAQPN